MYKHENGYWYSDFEFDGKRYRKSLKVKDKDQAIKKETQMREKIIKSQHLGECVWTWADAVESYRNKKKRKDVATTMKLIRWINPHFDAAMDEKGNFTKRGIVIDKIDAKLIGEVEDASNRTKLGGTRKGLGTRSQTTTRHHLTTIRKVLKHAVKKGQLPVCPTFDIPEADEWDGRFLTYEEADNMLAILKKRGTRSSHLYDGIRFALATGLRHSNIANLQWRNVDMEGKFCWVDSSSSKSKKPIRIPLNDEAIGIIRSRMGSHKTHVFSFAGHPTELNGSAWKRLRKEAGVPWCRFHDLRHTWASWHAMAGTPLPVLQVLGGWHTIQMVQRYAHLSKSHCDQFANNSLRPVAQPEKADVIPLRAVA